MRITSTQQANRLRGAKGVQQGASSGGAFRAESAGRAGTPQKTAKSLAIGSVDALLALQSVGGNAGRRAKAVKRGHSMLDILEELRLDLLAGSVSDPKLKKLLDLVRASANPGAEDSALGNLLDDIELRARVELAKRGLADT